MGSSYHLIHSDKSICLIGELIEHLGMDKVDMIITESPSNEKRVSVIVCKSVSTEELSSLLVFITLKTSITSRLVVDD